VEQLAPEKVIVIRDPHVGLEAVVVVDNTACGPAIGSVRMAPDVSIEEVARLARAMTLKNAASGLPHGGGKAGIAAGPGLTPEKKEALVRSFARAIRDLREYIPGPDMGTDEACMAWVHDEINRAVGIPRVLGGIPLDVIGATGLGLAVCAEVAQEYSGIDLQGARVAIQGFGAVGRHAARFLEERGTVTVAVADSQGGVFNSSGLRLADLLEFKPAAVRSTAFPRVSRSVPMISSASTVISGFPRPGPTFSPPPTFLDSGPSWSCREPTSRRRRRQRSSCTAMGCFRCLTSLPTRGE
jgi:glutamate dehydrogenase (NAD(P)+)/glutamate dehydrogenase (NADP+)